MIRAEDIPKDIVASTALSLWVVAVFGGQNT